MPDLKFPEKFRFPDDQGKNSGKNSGKNTAPHKNPRSNSSEISSKRFTNSFYNLPDASTRYDPAPNAGQHRHHHGKAPLTVRPTIRCDRKPCSRSFRHATSLSHFRIPIPEHPPDTGVSAHRPFPCRKRSTFPIHEPVCLPVPLIFAGPSPYFPQNFSRENILAAQ